MATTPRHHSDPELEARVSRLTTAAARRVIEPDEAVPGGVGDDQVIPDELLTVADLDLGLDTERRRRLAREEVAAITEAGIRFEAVLMAGFAMQLASSPELTRPELTFVLHEIGEETRHSRLFQRLVASLAPTAPVPVSFRLVALGYRLVVDAVMSHRALFYTLVLAGEEIPDLYQKLAAELPGTDPFLREVSRYHRTEEARHLSFARATLPRIWARASAVDRALVAAAAPRLIRGMADTMVHPGVYQTVGLPGWQTWRAARRSPGQVQFRWEATRPVLAALRDAGVFPRGVPGPWRRLCGVDRHGVPMPDRGVPWRSRGQHQTSEPAPPAPNRRATEVSP